MNARYLILLCAITLLILPALATPTTPTVSLIGSNNATFTSTSGATTCWFRWGVNNVNPEWKTANQTCGSPFSAVQYGSPYYPSVVYYVQACDDSGTCTDPTLASFTSAATTPLPQTTYGAAFDNITQSGFNIIFIIQALPTPYLWEFPTTSYALGIALLAGLLISFYFIGLWLRQRKVTGPVLIGMMILAFFLTPQAGFNWGMPPEMAALAQMISYAALAGMIMGLIKKG